MSLAELQPGTEWSAMVVELQLGTEWPPVRQLFASPGRLIWLQFADRWRRGGYIEA